MKEAFKILGVFLILAIGLGFVFYGQANHNLAKAERAYNHGNFKQAEFFYKKGIDGLRKWPFSAEKIELARAWSFYNQGYYNSEKYELAERIIKRESNRGSSRRDQFHNLRALIYWQEGVDLFIKIGEKAANSKELDKLIDRARISSGKAIKANDGKDWDIKYNYEFFRQPKKKLKQYMQQAAKQKKKDREIKKKTEQISKEKKIKPNQQSQKRRKVIKRSKKERAEILIPKDKKKNSESEPTTGSNKKKKKKKG